MILVLLFDVESFVSGLFIKGYWKTLSCWDYCHLLLLNKSLYKIETLSQQWIDFQTSLYTEWHVTPGWELLSALHTSLGTLWRNLCWLLYVDWSITARRSIDSWLSAVTQTLTTWRAAVETTMLSMVFYLTSCEARY